MKAAATLVRRMLDRVHYIAFFAGWRAGLKKVLGTTAVIGNLPNAKALHSFEPVMANPD